MELTDGTETLTFPIERWEIYSNPTLDFMFKQGFAEVVSELPLTPTPEEELQLKRQMMVVTPWQICKALNQFGLIDNVETIVAASNNKEMQYGWTRATSFERLNQFISIMAYSLGLTDEEVDELFELAITL